MTNVWCVRAGGGIDADNFLSGGFVGIGWRQITEDLGPVRNREQPLGSAALLPGHPERDPALQLGLAEFRVRGFRARQGRISRPAHPASRDHSITPKS
jgi:hypothetical protein